MSNLVDSVSEARAMESSSMNRAGSAMKTLAKKVLNKDTRNQLRRLAYAGSKYHCNVCDSSSRTMLTTGNPFPVLSELDVVGGETLPYDTCPICFSNSRTRLLSEYIKREFVPRRPESRIRTLHIAPEYGILRQLRAMKMIDYVGGDLNPEQYRSTTADVVRCDVTAIEHGDEDFDLIICSHVLEHVPDDRLAMRELFRVLKAGGTAILQVPMSASLRQTIEDPNLTDPRERERRFGQHDHVRIYGADYTDRLRESGFIVEVFDPTSRWGAAVVDKLRLNPRERIFVGRKGG